VSGVRSTERGKPPEDRPERTGGESAAPPEYVCERLAVVGLGLIGGSVALAARERGLAREVVGVDVGLERAGAIPLVSLADGVRGADLVVLAVPAEATDACVTQLAPHANSDPLLSDTLRWKRPFSTAA